MEETYYAFFRLFIAFPIVILLIYGVLRYLLPRYLQPAGYSKNIKILESAALNPRTHLYIVRIKNHYLLLASSSGEVSVLKDLGETWREGSPEPEPEHDGPESSGTRSPFLERIAGFFPTRRDR
jgi:flagellar biogenesis protein FliO